MSLLTFFNKSVSLVSFVRIVTLAILIVILSNPTAVANEKRWSGWYVGATGLSQEIDDDRLDGYGFYFGWGYQPSNPQRKSVVSHEFGLGIDDTGSSTVLWTSSTLGWQNNGVVWYADLGLSLYSLYGFPVGTSADLGVGIEIPVNPYVSFRVEYSRAIADDHYTDISLGRAGIGLTYRIR